MSADLETDGWIQVCPLEELERDGVKVVSGEGRPVAVFLDQARGYALDNRCPHMGFPLEQGSVRDGILTCHWHQARFDLRSGRTFDLCADDVPRYEVRTDEEGTVWVSSKPTRPRELAGNP